MKRQIPISNHNFVDEDYHEEEITESEQDSVDEDIELPVDIIKQGHYLIILTPVIGAGIEDLNVTVNNNTMLITKDATPITEDFDQTYVTECHWGPISRELHLPLPVDPNGATASLKDGILRISLPIISKHQPKIIKIE